MRRGVRLGIDVGTVRIGVAKSDPDGLLASGVETIARDRSGRGSDVARLRELVAEWEPLELIVGLPLALSGVRTASTEDAVGFAGVCAAAIPVPVRLVDERLTTVSATGALHASRRRTRGSRPVIDQVAASILLQHALDAERMSGRPPGEPLAGGA